MDELIHELRSYAHQRLFDGSEKYDQHILYLADQIEEEMANYVELPKDADGEYIHIGDELEYKYGRFVVSQLTFYVVDGKKGLFWSSDDPINEEWVGLSGQCGVPLARHVQPDSWERIIEDAQADGVRYHNNGKPSDFDALVERCKRLAGEVE